MMTVKSKFTDAEAVMGELIGLKVTIKKSSQSRLAGISGTIIDETLKMFVIGTGEKELKIPKKDCVFEFVVSGKKIGVDGKKLAYRPEDRIKKHWRKYDGRMQR